MKTEKIINKTPHPIYILGDGNTVLKHFPKSSGMIRVASSVTDIGFIEGVPICKTEWGDTEDVPAPIEGTYYIVSQLVKNALTYRNDLLVPTQVVRDPKNGQIIGCKRLSK